MGLGFFLLFVVWRFSFINEHVVMMHHQCCWKKKCSFSYGYWHTSIRFDFSLQSKVEESVEQSFGYYSGNDGSTDLQVVILCGNPTIYDWGSYVIAMWSHVLKDWEKNFSILSVGVRSIHLPSECLVSHQIQRAGKSMLWSSLIE